MITSWALRRSPWPLTEYSLIAGAMTLRNPHVSRREIDTTFASEHFGVADPQLAKIPQLLGKSTAMGLVESHCEIDTETGHWLAESYNSRREQMMREPKATRRSITILRRNAARARVLLERARPHTPQQHARIRLWWWAHDVLAYFAEFAPEMLKELGRHDPDRLQTYQHTAKTLARRTNRLLKPLFTDWTMITEEQTRFGEHLKYLHELRQATVRVPKP
jgi:hypothetical protein